MGGTRRWRRTADDRLRPRGLHISNGAEGAPTSSRTWGHLQFHFSVAGFRDGWEHFETAIINRVLALRGETARVDR